MNIINNKPENSNSDSNDQISNLTVEEKKARLLKAIADHHLTPAQPTQPAQTAQTAQPAQTTSEAKQEDDTIDMYSSKSDFISSKDVKSDLVTDVAQNDHPEFIVDVAVSGLTDTNIDPDSLELTPEIKNEFVKSIVTGDRFTQRYKFLDGKLTVTFRNRSIAEDRAIINNLSHLERIGVIKNRLEYQDRLRIALLTAQVATLNDVDFKVLSEPLTYTVDGINVIPPGWEDQEKFWASKPPALIVMLIKQLKIFESIYWTLTSKASIANFWKTGTHS